MAEPIATVGKLAGVCGHDGADWQKVGISASDRLQVETEDPSGADLTDVISKLADILTELNAKLETADLTSATTRYINTLSYQYDGSAWHKSNLIFGYYDRLVEDVRDLTLAAGNQFLNGTQVPDGEVWVVTCVNSYVASASVDRMAVQINFGGTIISILNEVPPTSGYYYVIDGLWVLKKDDYVRWYATDLTLNDDGILTYSGYKMKIDM